MQRVTRAFGLGEIAFRALEDPLVVDMQEHLGLQLGARWTCSGTAGKGRTKASSSSPARFVVRVQDGQPPVAVE